MSVAELPVRAAKLNCAMSAGIVSYYEGWPRANAHLVNRIQRLGTEALELRAAPESWPIWAIVGHLASTRVYWLCGVAIPRDAYQQAAWDGFMEVAPEELRAGDLVFFAGDDDPKNRKITHVGIALADGRFIHASGKAGVTITPLEESPYDRQFHCARRAAPAGR